MLLLLCILLSTAGDEFTCKSNELQEAMPLLKQIVSHQCYSSLEKIVASSKKQSNVPADALGKMVMDCASNEEERALCCAVIRVKHGYYSITDPFISRFAQLDESQESRIRAFNTVCLDAVNATVKDITDHSSREAFVKAWIRAQSIYQKNYETGIASILNEDQRARLNKVYVKYDHASAVQRLLTKRLSERSTIGPLQLGNQQTHHPNIQMHFSAGYLILLDNKAARDHLHLTPAQLEAVVELYEQYASAVDELQLSLSQTYSKSTPETYHTHQKIAQQKSEAYKHNLSTILDKKQQVLGEKLLAQVIGIKGAFSFDVANRIGITSEQQRAHLQFIVTCMGDFIKKEKRPQGELNYDWSLHCDEYVNERVANELLTPEQRKKWLELVSPLLNDADLRTLRKAYFQRTHSSVKPPAK